MLKWPHLISSNDISYVERNVKDTLMVDHVILLEHIFFIFIFFVEEDLDFLGKLLINVLILQV